jgi:hypothetical protein
VPLIRHYGFEYPPVGIIHVLKQVAPADSKIYILDPIGGQELPYHDLDANTWVIITTNEGSSHKWFDRLIPQLASAGVSLNHIVIRSACLWDPDSPVRHIHTIVDECSDFVTMLQDYLPTAIDPTHHFVCLNNGHRWQRFELTCEILKRNLTQFGHVSYVQPPPVTVSGFPILIDRSEVSWHEQRNINFPELSNALYNVICETAYESESGVTQLTHHHRPGMTEKSYKCFALFQIPVWLASYRAVACYRELGFDVFDDIIDHSYDLESDPVKRISRVADEIQRICDQSHTQLLEIKNQLLPRFEHNWTRLRHYAHNFSTELPQWKVLFSHNNSN